MGFLQLGRALPPVHRGPARLQDTIQLQCPTAWRGVRRSVHWINNGHPYKYLPGEISPALYKGAGELHPRETSVLQLRSVGPDASRPILVWLDLLTIYSLDCADSGNCMRNYRNLLHLPSHL